MSGLRGAGLRLEDRTLLRDESYWRGGEAMTTMTPGEMMVWAAEWARGWNAGGTPRAAAISAAEAVDALRGASLPDDAAAADMLRQMRGEQ